MKEIPGKMPRGGGSVHNSLRGRRMSMMLASYVILVEDAEHQRGELGRIALREELLVNTDETLYRDNNNQMLIKVNLVRDGCTFSVKRPLGQSLRNPLCL